MTEPGSMAMSRRSWRRQRSATTASRPKSGALCQCTEWATDMARVLIIEDNPDNMDLAVFLLQSAGHTVLCALDAEAGLVVARDKLPDLILMDIQLPGMDGLKATSLLKLADSTRSIPVLAFTALAMRGDEERMLAGGCDGYIAKPIGVRNFLATVAAHLAVA